MKFLTAALFVVGFSGLTLTQDVSISDGIADTLSIIKSAI